MHGKKPCVILTWLFLRYLGADPALLMIKRGEIKMKEGIHPTYYQANVTCNCGNTFVTGSTKQDIHVEICSKCHPFYTGQQKATQARGRIEKFNRKYGLSNN